MRGIGKSAPALAGAAAEAGAAPEAGNGNELLIWGLLSPKFHKITILREIGGFGRD